MEQRISAVTLGVQDIGVARRFYESLGWAGESPDDEVVFFQAGGLVVALWSRALLAEDGGLSDPGGWGGITLSHNVRSPDEVDAVLAAAVAAGAVITQASRRTSWGGYAGAFTDLDGHPWEIVHNPGWPLHDDGTVSLH